MDLLGVVEGTAQVSPAIGSAEPAGHRFLDWTVNGDLLRGMLGWATPPSESTVMVSGWSLDAALSSLKSLRLQGGGEFPDGRAAILVCEVCGDLECGALSVRVTRSTDTVCWSDFGWQVPRTAGFDSLEVPLRFEFAVEAYDGLLTLLERRLTAGASTPMSRRRWREESSGLQLNI